MPNTAIVAVTPGNPEPPKNGLLGLPIITGKAAALIGDDLQAINIFQTGVDAGLARIFCPIVTVATTNQVLPGVTVNGHALASGESVVLAAQTAPAENGIYTSDGTKLARHPAFPVGAKLHSEVFTDMLAGRNRTSYIASGVIGTDATFKAIGADAPALVLKDAVVFSGMDGDITAGSDLLNAVLPYGMKIAANFAGCFFRVNGTAPTAAAVFEVKKTLAAGGSATVVQTITVASGQRTGTFATSAELVLAAGDLLTVTAKTPSGATKISFTFPVTVA